MACSYAARNRRPYIRRPPGTPALGAPRSRCRGAFASDYSVCTTWGYNDNKFYLPDVFRKRLNYPELRRAVIDQAKRFGVFNILIEERASGTQLIQDLEAEGLMGVIAYGPP